MNLRKIADALGIVDYPAALEQATPVDVCNLELIETIHNEYNIFKDHYEDVLQGVASLQKDENRRIWGEYACGYLMGLSLEEAKKFPLPMEEGVGDLLPLLIQLPMIPGSVKVYRKRGFDEETIHQTMASYYDCANSIFNKTGTFGLDLRFHRWMLIYAKSLIFRHMGFNMEVRSFPDSSAIIKNKKTGEVLPLVWDVPIHESGKILGSAGYEFGMSAPIATFRETADGFYGYAARNACVSRNVEFFPKAQWELAIVPGDKIISVHLPNGTDISVENVDNAFRTVIKKVATWYPDAPVKCLYCGSWLLDPTLGDLIGKQSKIVRFSDRFVRWPVKSDGQEIFRFIFPGKPEDLNDLPENTRLEKGLKNLYLNGGYIYGHRGVIL